MEGNKKMVSLRLSQRARHLPSSRAAQLGVRQSVVLEILLHATVADKKSDDVYQRYS